MPAKKTKKKTRSTKAAKPLDAREQRYKANRIGGMSMRKAALRAGYSVHMADHAGDKIEPKVNAELVKAMEAEGITDELLAKRIREGLDAKKTEFGKFKGLIKSTVETIDFSERRQMALSAARIRGVKNLGTAVEDDKGAGTQVVVLIDC
jgi:hypothetical protein